ncbi:phosphotransferase enzyme family protein [Pseudomonas sp. TE3610]
MSQALHSHGLAGEEVAPVWAPLTAGELQPLLAQYPQVGWLQRIDWHSPRPFSAAALVSTASGEWFIKRHAQQVRSAAWLEEEHRFIAHLRTQGIPAPDVQISETGATAIASGPWTYEIHARSPGDDLYRDAQSWSPFQSTAHALAAGAALARLHNAAEGFDDAPRQTDVLTSRCHAFTQPDPLATLALQIDNSPALTRYLANRDWRAELSRALLPAHANLLPHLAAQPPLWTHNDWHASNLLWAGGHVSSVLDFGLCDRTCALYDLATALERNAIPWLDLDVGGVARADLATVDALLSGYASERALPAIDALIAWLPLVHADFAVSETEYFEGILNDRASADIAWDDYLLRHADWFNGPEGQRLLDHLRQGNGS